jgi:hypothetical protein
MNELFLFPAKKLDVSFALTLIQCVSPAPSVASPTFRFPGYVTLLYKIVEIP